MLPLETLKENLAEVERRILAACTRAGRSRDSVQLVAVTKRHPPELVKTAWDLGLRHFGENYAQELRDKHEALSAQAGIRWHAIGPVQPKNAKYVAKAAHVFHALERLEVAQELSRRRTGAPLRCFVEVNVAGEASKAGLEPSSVAAFIEQVRALPNLEVAGLMCMPPLDENPEISRPAFKQLAQLAKQLGLSGLSMGTTGDFEVAIEEGATHVRVGTALFGERPAA
ncbi:MAG: YggS family pyridoxal phosphate-dependent enzyme [Archangiaceae bacterium]|nr:YggS family pyridoxal phosphate-dependent enzyme [Archangiaceae bacterium]